MASDIQPDWMKPQNWPERRRAPGYPRRYALPTFIVVSVTLPLAIFGFNSDLLVLAWTAVAFLVAGSLVVFHLTLSRFRCPECGRGLPLKWPSPGEFVTFPCESCNVIWLTGVQAAHESGG